MAWGAGVGGLTHAAEAGRRVLDANANLCVEFVTGLQGCGWHGCCGVLA